MLHSRSSFLTIIKGMLHLSRILDLQSQEGIIVKAQLVPVYFKRDRTQKFSSQTDLVAEKLKNYAELLPPIGLGDKVPPAADAAVFPEILGEAYEKSSAFSEIPIPILILTSEFMTISMWDWEIMNFLKGKGVKVLAPYNECQTRVICRSLAVRRAMTKTKFLIFQDNPGEGFQPDIFKCFYWWGDECTQRLQEKFGITIERRSLKALGEIEKSIPAQEAEKETDSWSSLPMDKALSGKARITAAKYYLAVKKEMGDSDTIGGIGANCLNESRYSSSTPCIAWNLLFEREKILWACEGDTLSLALKYLLYHSLQVPVMMTNIYPVLMGMAALKHEGIPSFPEILDEPENHVLMAHCGFFGLAPQSFCDSWKAVPPVLSIVDKLSHALDARLPCGPITMVKIDAEMENIMVIEGELKGYVQYPGSDCRNGAIVKVRSGHALMKQLYSHHQLIMTGHQGAYLELVASVFGLTVERLKP